MNGFTIQTAGFAAIPSLVRMYHALGGRPAGYAERCLGEQQEGRRQVFVLAQDGRDIGMAMLNWQPLYAPFRRLGIPEIQDLAILPEARRQGAGAALVAYCEDAARARGGTDIGIAVGLTADFGAAQRLYARLGYFPDGFGVTYDRETVTQGAMRPVDENLCLMLMKAL